MLTNYYTVFRLTKTVSYRSTIGWEWKSVSYSKHNQLEDQTARYKVVGSGLSQGLSTNADFFSTP